MRPCRGSFSCSWQFATLERLEPSPRNTPSRFDPRAWRSTLRHNHPSGSIVSTLREHPGCSGNTRQWKHGNPLAVIRTSSLTVSDASPPQVIRRPSGRPSARTYGHLRWGECRCTEPSTGRRQDGVTDGWAVQAQRVLHGLVGAHQPNRRGWKLWIVGVEHVVAFDHADLHQIVHHSAALVPVPAHAPVQHPLVAEHAVGNYRAANGCASTTLSASRVPTFCCHSTTAAGGRWNLVPGATSLPDKDAGRSNGRQAHKIATLPSQHTSRYP